MKITVILCTYNRCQSLLRALESTLALRLPEPDDWEMLVIDNNSSDSTGSVTETFCQQHPGRYQYIFEATQGKSHALNTGIRNARGDVLAFMDDDVEVDSEWLARLVAPLKNGEWAGTGGRIFPGNGFVQAPWMDMKRPSGLAPLAMFDLGPEAHELKEAPFGTNMAFRKEMFAKYGQFRTDLGPQKGSEIRDEDTEFGARLLAGGERFWYEPSAIVYHAVPASRNQKAYFLKWWFDKARAEIRRSPPAVSGWLIAGIPPVLFRRLLRWTLQWIFTIHASNRFWCKIQVWNIGGAMRECLARRREGSTYYAERAESKNGSCGTAFSENQKVTR